MFYDAMLIKIENAMKIRLALTNIKSLFVYFPKSC